MTAMTRDQALEFLTEGTRTGKLATCSVNAVPHVAPIWFVLDAEQGDLVFTTGRDTIKGRHLTANPQAALTVDAEQYPYAFTVVRGRVRMSDDLEAMLEWATRIARRYVPNGQAEQFGQRNAVPGELLCRLSIERLSGQADIAL